MKKKNSSKRERRRGPLKIVFGCAMLVIALLILTACTLFRFDRWHKLDPERILGCERSLLIYDGSGELVCAMGSVKRIWVGIDSIPQSIRNAFVAAEDARFYKHDGIDLYRIFGAAWADIKAGGYVQGASTISQQLIKLSHLSTEKTLERKLEEAVLAAELESRFDKDEILEMYLNYVYFGGGYYGIEAASLGYFGKHASELTTAQAAQLAGVLKSPSAYAPHLDREASLARRNTVLKLMREYGYIDEDELTAAQNEVFEPVNAFPSERSCYTDYAVKEACKILGMEEKELLKSGYSLYTALDSGLDGCCADLFMNDESFPTELAQGALAVTRNDGSIIAMQGSRGEYVPGSLNRAVNIERQPGSLIKPILVYAPALEIYGCTAATALKDEPRNFGDYSPRNSDDAYMGVVTLRTAVTRSLNIPAVTVFSDIGPETAVMFAERMGISFEGEAVGLPLALGGFTRGVSPLEMAGAYSAIAGGGVYITPSCLNCVYSADGVKLYERSVGGERVMRSENAFILTSMLQSAASEGTAKRLAQTGLPLAAKTGTAVDSGGVRDAWCAAFSPEYTAVVWMGADSSNEGSLPESAVGGNQPALLLGKVFAYLYKDREYVDFSPPPGVTEKLIDTYAVSRGEIYLANDLTPREYTVKEYFVKGTEPVLTNSRWVAPDPPGELGWSVDPDGKPVISFTSQSRMLIYRVYRKDLSGGTVLIAELTGRSGYLACADKDAAPGETYEYYITAAHPDIKQNGAPYEGAPSETIRLTVPLKHAA